MPFLGYPIGGVSSAVLVTNPYLVAPDCRAHVILAHPAEPNGLILTRGDGEPFLKSTEGYLKSDGRSITGSVRVLGNQYKKDSADCNFVVDLAMVDQFRRLLAVQQSSGIPVTIIDNWTTGRKTTALGTITIGDNKWETAKPGGQFLIQFGIEFD